MNIRSWWIFSRVGWAMFFLIVSTLYIDPFLFRQWPVLLAGMGGADPIGYVAIAWLGVSCVLVHLDEDL